MTASKAEVEVTADGIISNLTLLASCAVVNFGWPAPTY